MTKVMRVKCFTVCWVYKVCGEKFRDFPITTLIYSWLSNSTKQLQAFQQKFWVTTWILLKIVISILGNGWMYITDTCVQISCFSGWSCSHRRRKATVEVSPRWNLRSLTASLSIILIISLTVWFFFSSASDFLISWQKHYRFFTTTVANISKFFMMSTFSGAKV